MPAVNVHNRIRDENWLEIPENHMTLAGQKTIALIRHNNSQNVDDCNTYSGFGTACHGG